MNKILGLFLVAGLLFISAPNVSAAQPITGCTLKHDIDIGGTATTTIGTTATTTTGTTVSEAKGYNNWGALCLLDAVYNITDWIFYGLLSLVSLLTVWGGTLIVWNGGDAEKIEKGRSYIIYATVGLIVAFLSKLIPSIAQTVIGA